MCGRMGGSESTHFHGKYGVWCCGTCIVRIGGMMNDGVLMGGTGCGRSGCSMPYRLGVFRCLVRMKDGRISE